jgi:hypothetical protein
MLAVSFTHPYDICKGGPKSHDLNMILMPLSRSLLKGDTHILYCIANFETGFAPNTLLLKVSPTSRIDPCMKLCRFRQGLPRFLVVHLVDINNI